MASIASIALLGDCLSRLMQVNRPTQLLGSLGLRFYRSIAANTYLDTFDYLDASITTE